jgi:hypothetical protein
MKEMSITWDGGYGKALGKKCPCWMWNSGYQIIPRSEINAPTGKYGTWNVHA